MPELQPLLLFKLIPHLHYKTQIEVDVINVKDCVYKGQASKIYDWFAFSSCNTSPVLQIGIDTDNVLIIKVQL